MTAGTPVALDGLRRVLVRAPNWLGDTVMAVPAIRAIRQAAPAAELWVLGPWAAAVLEAEPGIDRCLDPPAGWPARWRQARAIRRAGIDLAVLFPNSFESALAAWLGAARVRLGYAGDGRSALLTHAVPPPGDRRHQVALYLDLLRPLGLTPAVVPPVLRVTAARQGEARALLAGVGIGPETRAVGIQLGAAFGPSKLFPPARLAALATALDRDAIPVVFLGGPGAGDLLAAVGTAMARAPRSLVGRDHPALLPALLGELGALVTPDSGPAHVAAAVGVPVVAIFGPTDPRLTAPLGEGHAALWSRPPCAPCFRPRCPIDHRCVEAITVEMVAAAVRARRAPGASA